MHDFAGGSYGDETADGSHPTGQLLLASDGNLYGTCYNGGELKSYSDGAGTVFQLSPTTGAYATVKRFAADSKDAAEPYSGLVQGTDGALYGSALNGGVGWGALYKLALP